jgi:hypothetical protein
MKKRVYFIVILATLIFAGAVNAATFYVDNAGDDSIAHALLIAKKGDIIKINDGVYNEGQLNVPEGVSLTSTSQNASKVTIQPNKSIIGWPFINLSSGNPGSNGNQTISYLSFNGNTGSYRANMGLKVENRSNVKITHCNISDFTGSAGAYGVSIRSTEIGQTADWWEYLPIDPQAPGVETNFDALWPANPVENFELSYCNINKCGYAKYLYIDRGDISRRKSAAVKPYNLKNSAIHHNTVNTLDSWGQPIKGTCAFLDNVDIYNNDFTMRYYTGEERASFTLEVWLLRRGCEIYNNTSNGMFSITYGKETEVHDNTIIATGTDQYGLGPGIEFIGQSEGEVYNNYIEKAGLFGINVGLERHSAGRGRIVRNVKICNNIIYHQWGSAIGVINHNTKSGDSPVENIQIYNNICDNMVSRYTYTPLIYIRSENEGSGTVTTRNVTVKQNILVSGTGYAGSSPGAVSNLIIDENLFWDNYRDSWKYNTNTNSIIENPEFKATGDHSREYYKLQPDSPMYDVFNNGVAIEPPSNVSVENN